MNDISKDKDYQEFFAGIKELAKGLMLIRERAAIEYAPIVEEFCARKHATANEVGRMLDYLFEFADDERILLMYKKVCRRFVYDYPDTISYYIMEYRKEYDRESLIGTEYEYLLHEDDELFDKEDNKAKQQKQNRIWEQHYWHSASAHCRSSSPCLWAYRP